jgi:uncharacterized membrane protein YidH (DUF202 family)
MDTTPAPQSETPQTANEPWRRFTLLDLMVVFTGHEAGLGIMKWCGLLDGILNDKNDKYGILLIIALFFVFGSMISFPLIYGVQFLARHRSQRLSLGEIIGIANMAIWGVTFLTILSGFNPPRSLQMILNCCLLVYFNACSIGSIAFLARLAFPNKNLPCRWLDLYGFFQCVLFIGVVIAFLLVMITWDLDLMV